MPQSQTTYHIACLPGDGIGPEVTRAALRVMRAVADEAGFALDVSEHPFGGVAIDREGAPFPDATRAACLDADAVLLGAVGGPAWDDNDARPESGLLALRKALGVFANLRPVTVPEALVDASPLRPERVSGADVLIARELTGGIYFGEPSEHTADEAFSTMRYRRSEIARIARIAFEQARKRDHRVTSVDKANVLDVSRLWREVVTELHEREYDDVALDHLYVDNAVMQLARDPNQFDVILTGNLFGDILSDLAATLPGTLGMLPSASIGESKNADESRQRQNDKPDVPSKKDVETRRAASSQKKGRQSVPNRHPDTEKAKAGLFEPVHGSAPDITGQDAANPLAAILSGAMLLDDLGETRAADAIRQGVREALASGARTADLGGKASTGEMTRRVAGQAVAVLGEGERTAMKA